MPKKSGGIIIENDSVEVSYSFKGENCPVRIQVSNKLNTPLYVDWKKSALILNNERFSFWEDKATLNASSWGYEIHWTKNTSTTGSTTTGELVRAEQISFIPPHSFITATPLTAKSSFFELPPATKDQQVNLEGSGQTMTGKKYSFSKENSPMKFRNYLTLAGDEKFEYSFHFDNEFWVSDIISTLAAPADLAGRPSTEFSIRKTTGFANGVAVIIGIPLIVLLAVSNSHSK
ncbi:hypothetical protein WSM22_26920 [Cytophagales bacterium WSM2-2]|nr:hypothetical protein WSM22_26920 [Cytophagales bacterium WSM2-2]